MHKLLYEIPHIHMALAWMSFLGLMNINVQPTEYPVRNLTRLLV